MSNQISLFGSIKVDGLFIVGGQFFTDCAPGNIISVMLVNIKDQQRQTKRAFRIKYQDDHALTVHTFYMVTHTGMTTLDNFKAGLTAFSTSNIFTIYYGLVKGSEFPASMVPRNTHVLLNDSKYERSYAPGLNQTLLNVHVTNSLLKEQLFFQGDQTIAGYYYYFYSWGY